MSQKSYLPESVTRFTEYLKSLSGRGQLAELRRSAADPLGDFRSIRILGPFLPDDDGWRFDAYRLVGTLYALHRQRFSEGQVPDFAEGEKRRSFGASLRRLRAQLKGGQDSLDLRFAALLDTPAEDLAVPLRGMVQRCASAEKPVPVDYAQLLNDLLWWEGDRTRRKWAREYWQAQDVDQALANPSADEITNN